MNKVHQSKLAWLATVLLLNGCSAVKQQANDYANGWRMAQVVATSDAQRPYQPTHGDCRKTEAGTSDSRHRYVLVSYAFSTNPNLRNTRVISIPADQTVSIGESLRINIEQCGLTPKSIKNA